MIDTIVLVLNQNMFTITDHDRFEPSTKGLYDYSYGLGSRYYLTCKQNPTPTELKSGIYKPRLTVTKRLYKGVYQIMMKVEFSAPKLIYKNNFDELEENDFGLVVQQLQQKLKDMAVEVIESSLTNAFVSSIHYSKNVALTNGLTPLALLKEIQKANITKRLDFNQSDFRNEGHSIKFRTNSYEIAFYDKMRDMGKAKISEKRAIEDDNAIQMDLFEKLTEFQRYKPLEIIRMEIRLNQRQKIRQVLKLVGIDIEPTLQNLFKKDIAQKVLIYYLDLIEDNYPKSLYFEPKTTKDFVSQFIIDNPTMKLKDLFLANGFHNILKELSVREIREMTKRTPVSSWYRFYRQINSYNYSKNKASVFEPIRKSLNEFEPLKTVDFQAQMLNNDKYN